MKTRPHSFRSWPIAAILALLPAIALTEVRVSTDFEGGSARVESIDELARVIRFMPGGDPQRGWPCWWYLRVDGLEKDARWTLDLAGSDRLVRNSGAETGAPLAPVWAMPMRAALSTDGRAWQHTAPGRREGERIQYSVLGTGGPLWLAWGPPFTPRDTDALLAEAAAALPGATTFELARTREGRAVRSLHVNLAGTPRPLGIWIQARQHAWESGASWVARGFTEWLTSADPDAQWLRSQAEIFLTPIMDVDNVATGNGGKEAAPRDHNRDWDAAPHYPEIAAAQQRLRALASEGRLDVFLDLHNPSARDLRPFFFVGPPDLLTDEGRANRAAFLAAAAARIRDPLEIETKPRETGPKYHPLWKQISGQWVNANGNPQTLAACLETSWNTPHSTTDGYRTVGRQLGMAVADFLRQRAR